AGRVTLRLERGGERAGLSWNTDIGTGLTNGRQTSPQRNLASDEVRTPGRATGFRIVVGEPHPLARQLIEVRRLTRHDPLVVRADVKPTHIVAHDEQDVRLLAIPLSHRGRTAQPGRGQYTER